jgi:hypothetical protein
MLNYVVFLGGTAQLVPNAFVTRPAKYLHVDVSTPIPRSVIVCVAYRGTLRLLTFTAPRRHAIAAAVVILPLDEALAGEPVAALI